MKLIYCNFYFWLVFLFWAALTEIFSFDPLGYGSSMGALQPLSKVPKNGLNFLFFSKYEHGWTDEAAFVIDVLISFYLIEIIKTMSVKET